MCARTLWFPQFRAGAARTRRIPCDFRHFGSAAVTILGSLIKSLHVPIGRKRPPNLSKASIGVRSVKQLAPASAISSARRQSHIQFRRCLPEFGKLRLP